MSLLGSQLLQSVADIGNYVAIAILLIIVLALIGSSIKIVREYERVVVFTLGRLVGAKGPGVVFIVPIVNRVNKIDLRERYLEVPHQTCITKDNAPTDIDFLIYYKVVEATQSIVQVQNFTGASIGIATTTLRAVVGDIPLDELLAKREQINNVLRTKLDEVTERWGIKVTNVEIREIRPPADVQEAMVKQMSAERSRRAMVLEADGKRESAILVAEGDKKSTVLRAEGDKQSAILRAQGYAEALSQIFGAAKAIDAKTMALQYLDTLKALGASPSTKYIFPMEFTRRTIVVLQDEMRRVLDAARVLLDEYDALYKGDKNAIGAATQKVRKAEEDVVTLRSALIRELAQVGTLLINREDILRTAFAVEDIFGHINGVAFRMSQLSKALAKKKKYREAITDLLGSLIDGMSKLNEGVRGLSMNPQQSIEMAGQVQGLESEIDTKYREAIAQTMKTATGYKELIVVKEILESIEDCADAMLNAANATTVVALGS